VNQFRDKQLKIFKSYVGYLKNVYLFLWQGVSEIKKDALKKELKTLSCRSSRHKKGGIKGGSEGNQARRI